MEKLEKIIFIYGYVVPVTIMFVYTLWRFYSNLKNKKKYVSFRIYKCWPLLIPGASLFAVLILLCLLMEKYNEYVTKFINKHSIK